VQLARDPGALLLARGVDVRRQLAQLLVELVALNRFDRERLELV
jgi:hypothetical protein